MGAREPGANRAEVATCVRAGAVLRVTTDARRAPVVATDVDGAPGLVAGVPPTAPVVMGRPAPYLQAVEGEAGPSVVPPPRPHVLPPVAVRTPAVVSLATVAATAGRTEPRRTPCARTATAATVAGAVQADLATERETTLPVRPALKTAAARPETRILPARPRVPRLVASKLARRINELPYFYWGLVYAWDAPGENDASLPLVPRWKLVADDLRPRLVLTVVRLGTAHDA